MQISWKVLLLFYFVFIEIGVVWSQEKDYAPEPDWYKTYDVKFYSINLEANDTTTYIKGNTLVNLLIKQASDSVIFNFNSDLHIDSVYINGQISNTYKFIEDLFIIKNPKNFVSEEVLNVQVFYKGLVQTNSFFSSLSSEKDNNWNIPVTWTLSEPFGAKQWFPCKQQLNDKADSCWVSIIVPKGRMAGSVGVLTDTVSVSGSKVQFNWRTKFPISYYLISFTVSDYKDYSFYVKIPEHKDSMRVQNFVYNRTGYLESNKSAIDKTSDFLKLFSKLFGVYPFFEEKYGHCVAPIGGGMEHQTMTTLANFSYSLVSHELAHQWFGDYITCSSWQDIWINEGFASYCEYLALEFLNSKSEANFWMANAQGRALRESMGSVFIPASEAEDEYRIFSSNLSYKKGAAIIHMLRYQINNDSLFFSSIREYLSQFKFKTASGEDFCNLMEKKTNLDLTDFFNQWYYGKGYPQFDISWKSSGDSLMLNIEQFPSAKNSSFFKTPFDIKIAGNNMDTIIRLNQDSNPQKFIIKHSGQISSLEFDPNNWLLKKVMSLSRLPELPSIDDYFVFKPNPFTDNVSISFKTESAKDEKIKILSLTGKIVYEGIAKRKKEIVINTSDISPGVYLLVISHGDNKYIRKLIKVDKY